MNTKPRERVLMVLDHQEPDRVPVDNWFASEVAHSRKKVTSLESTSGCRHKDPTVRQYVLFHGAIEHILRW